MVRQWRPNTRRWKSSANFFPYEIEALREELNEVKEGKAEKARQDTKGKKKSLQNSTTPTEEEEMTAPESQGNKSTTPVPTSSGKTNKTYGEAKLRVRSCLETSTSP